MLKSQTELAIGGVIFRNSKNGQITDCKSIVKR